MNIFKMKKKFLLLIFLSLAQPVFALPPGYKLYYGLLHSHTLFSDGSGTPEEAYQMAKDNNLDFFAITEHNHSLAELGADERADKVLIANNHDLYNSNEPVTFTRHLTDGSEEEITAKSDIKAALDITDSTFLALYGQEFSSISKGNHINLFDYDKVINSDNGNFKQFYTGIKDAEANEHYFPVVQLNHPVAIEDLNSTEPNDYGIDDLGPSFKNLVKETGKYVSLLELLSGPATKNQIFGNYKYSGKFDLNDDDYYYYLRMGFKVSPTAGQDNHYKTWGTITDARTGVYSKSLARKDILEALRNRRTFATEDKNLQLEFYVNDQFMGSTLKAPANNPLNIKTVVMDPDASDGISQVFLFKGLVTPEASADTNILKKDAGLLGEMTRKPNNQFVFNGLKATGKSEFYFTKIIQNDGNRAWSAPVWINYELATGGINPAFVSAIDKAFFWTKGNSNYYHQKGCRLITSIRPENLVRGNTPPAGRILHKCVFTD